MSHSFVLIPETSDYTFSNLRRFFEREENGVGVIRCRILSDDGPYLHIQVECGADTPDAFLGEMQIPHHAVALVFRDVPDKTLGFHPVSHTHSPQS
jgi:hypothetical protein